MWLSAALYSNVSVVHDDHAGIRGSALGSRMMYVAPYMASDSNMRIIIRQYIC